MTEDAPLANAARPPEVPMAPWPMPKAPRMFEKRADAGQRERDVEALVLRHDEAADVRVVVGLVFDADAAALRIVEEADPLLHQRLLRQVEVEVVGAPEVAAAEVHVGARAEEVVGRPELRVDDLQVLALAPAAGRLQPAAGVDRAVGLDRLELASFLVVLEAQRRPDGVGRVGAHAEGDRREVARRLAVEPAGCRRRRSCWRARPSSRTAAAGRSGTRGRAAPARRRRRPAGGPGSGW